MEEYYRKFMILLEEEDKDGCLEYAFSLIRGEKLSIPELYEEILTKSMDGIECHNNERNLCIWKEHVRSGIVRTIIENMYFLVLEERKRKFPERSGKKAAVLCPDGEYHDMGARIAADYFTLLNWETIFVGNSTPRDEFIKVAQYLELDAVAISVTNSYNLVAARKTIELLKEKLDGRIKIYLGGRAFEDNTGIISSLQIDGYLNNFESLKAELERGDPK